MNNDYFEMNQLDASHSLNTDPEAYRIPTDADGQSGEMASVGEAAPEKAAAQSGQASDRMRISTVLFSLLALGLIVAVAAVTAVVFSSGQEESAGHYDAKETPLVTETDRPGADRMSGDAIGAGTLYDDCDIFTSPDRNSAVAGRLARGTDVLIFAAEGDYYKVGDQEQNVVGFVRKERVNIGRIDLGNPDQAEIVDGETGEVLGVEDTQKAETGTSVRPSKFPVNSSPYFIYVEKGSHTVTIYGKDSKGKYTVPRKTFLIATGRKDWLTPVGDFSISGKERWHAWGGCYAPYCCKFYGGLFIHGPLYKEKDFGTLMIGSVSQIGTDASSGCLRTSTQAAFFIYQYCRIGTNIKIVDGSPLHRDAGVPLLESQYTDPAASTVLADGIELGFESSTMSVGQSMKVSVSFKPSNTSNKDCTWSSSNPSVVSVSGSGVSCTVKARKEGSAVITATSADGGHTASFTVTVTLTGLPDDSSSDPSDVSSDVSQDDSSDSTSSDGGSTTVTSGQENPASTTSASASSSDSTSTEG